MSPNNPFTQFARKQETVEDVKVVEAEAPKPEEVKTVTEKDEPKTTILLTEMDARIHDRMKSQPKSLDDVVIKVDPEKKDGKHRLSLPDELVPHLKKYAFRWIYKSNRAMDEACNIRGWLLVNRTYFPEIPDYLISSNGGVERGDNILAFMPKEKAELLRTAPGLRSREIVDGTIGKHQGNPNFYKPTDSEDERVIMI